MAPPTVAADASIADGVIAIGAASADAVAMTTDGTATGRLLAVVTTRDLMPAFGDQPAAILSDIRRAADTQELRALNQRARACALQHFTSAASDRLDRAVHRGRRSRHPDTHPRPDRSIRHLRLLVSLRDGRTRGVGDVADSSRGPDSRGTDERLGSSRELRTRGRKPGGVQLPARLRDAVRAVLLRGERGRVEPALRSLDAESGARGDGAEPPALRPAPAPRSAGALGPGPWGRRPGRRPRHPVGPCARLPREPSAAHVLPGRRHRGLGRTDDRLPSRAQRLATARRRRPGLRHGRAAGDGDLDARSFRHRARSAACARGHLSRCLRDAAHRPLAARPHRDQPRARPDRSSPRRFSAATIAIS